MGHDGTVTVRGPDDPWGVGHFVTELRGRDVHEGGLPVLVALGSPGLPPVSVPGPGRKGPRTSLLVTGLSRVDIGTESVRGVGNGGREPGWFDVCVEENGIGGKYPERNPKRPRPESRPHARTRDQGAGVPVRTLGR